MVATSSAWVTVPLVLTAPTVMTVGSVPGLVIPPQILGYWSVLPRLPAETMVTIPASTMLRTA